jgi:hypothetical protein
MGEVGNVTTPPLYTGNDPGGWASPRGSLDGCQKSLPPPHQNSIPGPSRPWRGRVTVNMAFILFITTFCHCFPAARTATAHLTNTIVTGRQSSSSRREVARDRCLIQWCSYTNIGQFSFKWNASCFTKWNIVSVTSGYTCLASNAFRNL